MFYGFVRRFVCHCLENWSVSTQLIMSLILRRCTKLLKSTNIYVIGGATRWYKVATGEATLLTSQPSIAHFPVLILHMPIYSALQYYSIPPPAVGHPCKWQPSFLFCLDDWSMDHWLIEPQISGERDDRRWQQPRPESRKRKLIQADWEQYSKYWKIYWFIP